MMILDVLAEVAGKPDDAENALFKNTAFVVLGAYLVLLLWLGYLGYRKSKNSEEDYYLAGRGQGWIVSSLTIMATFFSSFALLGAPGIVYRDGVIFALFALNVPVGALAVFILGSRIRRVGRANGYVTPGDMISDYYGGGAALRLLVALIGALYAIPYVLIQMNAGGVITKAMFPDNESAFAIGSGCLAVITMLYVMVGGMRSVAWTDVIQGSLLIFGMLLAGFAAVAALGGVGGFLDSVAELPAKSLSAPGTTGGFPPEKLFTICAVASIGSMVQPAQWMRYYSASSSNTLRRSALVFGTVLPICFLFGVMLVGLGGQALYPTAEEGGKVVAHSDVGSFDSILIVVLKNHLPHLFGFVGIALAALICVAVMAASMSTADSNLHALSAVFTRDIYARYLRPKSGEGERTWVGRTVIVAATAVAVLLIELQRADSSFEPYKLIASMGFLAIAFSSQLIPLTIDILFVRRGSSTGAVSGIVAGLFVLFFFTPFFSMNAAGNPTGDQVLELVAQVRSNIDLGSFALVANIVVFVVVSKFTKKPSQETRDQFAEAIRPKTND